MSDTPSPPRISDGAHPSSEPSELEVLTGPFYDAAGVRMVLGITEEELAKRVTDMTVLCLQTREGQSVFPTWQFAAQGGVIPRLGDVLQALSAGAQDLWTAALWLTAPNEDWDDLTAWEWLAAGHGPQPVLTEAHADAARWTS